jgi:hypothetical protein
MPAGRRGATNSTIPYQRSGDGKELRMCAEKLL